MQLTELTTIPRSEVRFHPFSYADSSGRVFEWGGRLYRGITAQAAPLYRRLFDEGQVSSWIEQGFLVGT